MMMNELDNFRAFTARGEHFVGASINDTIKHKLWSRLSSFVMSSGREISSHPAIKPPTPTNRFRGASQLNLCTKYRKTWMQTGQRPAVDELHVHDADCLWNILRREAKGESSQLCEQQPLIISSVQFNDSRCVTKFPETSVNDASHSLTDDQFILVQQLTWHACNQTADIVTSTINFALFSFEITTKRCKPNILLKIIFIVGFQRRLARPDTKDQPRRIFAFSLFPESN